MTTKKMLLWLLGIAVLAVLLWYGVTALAPEPEDFGAIGAGTGLLVA